MAGPNTNNKGLFYHIRNIFACNANTKKTCWQSFKQRSRTVTVWLWMIWMGLVAKALLRISSLWIFGILQDYMRNSSIRIHISQVSSRLSCSDVTLHYSSWTWYTFLAIFRYKEDGGTTKINLVAPTQIGCNANVVTHPLVNPCVDGTGILPGSFHITCVTERWLVPFAFKTVLTKFLSEGIYKSGHLMRILQCDPISSYLPTQSIGIYAEWHYAGSKLNRHWLIQRICGKRLHAYIYIYTHIYIYMKRDFI